MLPTHHRTATVDAQQVFYREAGPEEAPTVLLLRGFPSSSHMFRHLIPGLADRYHVIAADHVGYGQSSMPQADEFTYTFDHLAAITAGLLEKLGIRRFSVYVHDYGAPIRWRPALNPAFEVTVIISQGGRQRLHGGGLRRTPLGRSVLVRDITRSRHRARRAGEVQRRDHVLAVRELGRGPEPGQPGQLAARPDPAEQAGQRPGAAGALPGLPDEHPGLPAAP
ncbi:alpha/beta fold hydrolase [Streptomyces sp. NPDC101234]|uniref:alpha/beta fold hydrolase n=1 Tax=Streptomyces sp. NPDC101234 TaxID=3366138 RepID=UPI0037F74943